MIRVRALVEGQTERNFGQQILARHLGSLGVGYSPNVVGKPGHKGGVPRWQAAKREILSLLKQHPVIGTTMFDLYRLPEDWPGCSEAKQKGLKKLDAALKIEQAIESDIASAMDVPAHALPFFAYLSVHEFEALLFSDPHQLASVTMGHDHEKNFAAVLAQCGGCEDINGDPLTAPCKRILQIAPNYNKAADGPIAAQRIGLQSMRSKCPHFNVWLTRLECLAQT